MKRWPPSNKRPISSFQPPSSPPHPSLSFLARALQHARIRDRDLFILTKITRGPARRVIDRATLCRFILPLPLRLLSLLPSPSCSFSPTCPRLPPRPSIIIPLKPTFHASPLFLSLFLSPVDRTKIRRKGWSKNGWSCTLYPTPITGHPLVPARDR